AIDVARRLLTRPDSRDKRTGLLQVFRNVFRIEHQCRVEEAEEDDTGAEQQDVQRLAGSDRLGDIRQPAHALGLTEPLPQGSREQQNTAGEDRRDDARHVDLQRQVARLRSEDLAALLTLGIVNGDPPLTTLDEYHETDD